MARIEQLVKGIADGRVRKLIAEEIQKLKAEKRFGLVFEEHLPETVRLPNFPVRPGELVAERNSADNRLWLVRSTNSRNAICVRAAEGKNREEKRLAIKDLVVVKRFGEAIYPTLVSVDKVERGANDKPWHILIDADNFHALQLLLYPYERQVDMIYIDPPYNSGARDWKYNNDYVDRTDVWRHSKWLSMMKRRLLLARRLLKQDGVLVVTIDENEIYHLGMLLEQVFPEYLRHMVTIVINPKGTGKLNFARVDEYAMVCVPDTGEPIISGSLLSQEQLEEDEPDQLEAFGGDESASKEELSVDTSESWDRPFPPEEVELWEQRHARRRGSESSYRHQRWRQFYPIFIDPSSEEVVRAGDSLPLDVEPSFEKDGDLVPLWPIDDEGNHRCWRFVPTSMNALIAKGRVIVGRYNKKRNTWTLNIWERKPSAKRVKTVWWNSSHDAGTHGTTLLHKILGRRATFPFPKSIHAVRDTLAMVCGNRPDALILDFFAGSGTTYQATCMLNAE